jgi:hypothetical protein
VGGGQERKIGDLNALHLTGVTAVAMTLDPADAPMVMRDIGTADL